MTCHALWVLMWPKPSWTLPCAPRGRWAVPNDASGVTTLVDRVKALHPTLIVLEATGGLERAVTSALATRASRRRREPAAGPGFCPSYGPTRQNGRVGCPRPGPLCRRDPPDAATAARRPDEGAARPPGAPPATARQRTAEQNRLAGTSARLTKDIEAHITWPMRASPRWTMTSRRCSGPARCGGKTTICCRVPRVLGPSVPARCCWKSPSWGRSHGRGSRLVGVAPRNGDSGTFRGRRTIWGGRALCAPCYTWAPGCDAL